MRTVRIRHPEAGEAEVPESAVPHWGAAGWEVVPDEPPAEKPKQNTKAEDSTPRRRQSKESD